MEPGDSSETRPNLQNLTYLGIPAEAQISSPSNLDPLALLPAIPGTILLARLLWERLQKWRGLKRAEREAEMLFQDVFRLGGVLETVSIGRRNYSAGYHPDNAAALDALSGPLGILDKKKPTVLDQLQLATDADIMLIGGPNSTPLT